MFEIRRYRPNLEKEWNAYVAKARNATFLFNRSYMDYHSNRFEDYSIMFYKNGHLHSILPAHIKESVLYSHFGLTYGGLLMDINVTAADTVQLFKELNVYLKNAGITKVVYRPVPYIYHQIPAEEDLYAIFWHCHARLLYRNIGTTIFMRQNLRWRKDHRRRLKNAQSQGIRVERDSSIEDFWKVLEDNLMKKFCARPVHTKEEILLLKSRFPNEIIQYNAFLNEQIIGGITFYIMPNVIHGQYSSTNDLGKQYGAMEAIYEQVMYHDYTDYTYLDFGSSTEENGSIINEGLIAHKEGYGGRAVCYDTYEWLIP